MKTLLHNADELVKRASIALILISLLCVLMGCETSKRTAADGLNTSQSKESVDLPPYSASAATFDKWLLARNYTLRNMKMDDGSIYSGKVGLRPGNILYVEGNGEIVYASGIKYVGEFKEGKPNGNGVYTYPDGHKYAGQVKGGKSEGQGVLTEANGVTHSGEWLDGRPEGPIAVRDSHGTSRTDTWKEGKKIRSVGTDVWPDGTTYVGEWNYDGTSSHGTITWKDGREYKGEWKIFKGGADLPDGEGAMTWPDRRKYMGNFKDGKMDGNGRMIYPGGKVENGVWLADRFVSDKP